MSVSVFFVSDIIKGVWPAGWSAELSNSVAQSNSAMQIEVIL